MGGTEAGFVPKIIGVPIWEHQSSGSVLGIVVCPMAIVGRRAIEPG